MTRCRVVLDTNVIVAASRSRQGASFAVLQALRDRHFTALISVPLVLEYEAVLKSPEQLEVSRRSPGQTDRFLDALSLLCEPISFFYLWRPQTRDPADEMVLETALNGGADGLVTHNLDDFAAAATKFKLELWRPGIFLERLKRGG
ncbi:MAG: putative toxin-antitoxin system toxin component, PIN family [Deltaproteobacteria bacterium]|nr:putative toxin-antitoxin system toxin component, PIN family [Deltaproteobacteria bacterium]